MKKIYKIPIIGYLCRWLVAIVKLPKRFDYLFEKSNGVEQQQQRINEQQQRINEQQQRINEQQQRINEQQQRIEKLQSAIDRIHSNIGQNEKIILQSVEDIVDLKKHSFNRLLSDGEKLEKLNTVLSIHPTIWGDKKKLSISPLAAVGSCTLNTNSGKILIGDYTFAGSHVSILAGSHDMNLSGLLRRDAEYKEGYDIKIGNGVWLASNSTILGPCEIGDNAVVAAGAVVVPGTVIHANEVYAGVPARKVSQLDFGRDKESKSIKSALDRNDGILFTSGWTDKRITVKDGIKYIGHWICDSNSTIVFSKRKIKLLFIANEVVDEAEVIVNSGNEVYNVRFDGEKTTEIIELNYQDESIKHINICHKNKTREIFVTVI